MTYDSRIDNHIRKLQKAIDTDVDGAWGDKSQTALIESGKKLKYNWSKLRSFSGGKLDQRQVDGFNTLLKAVNKKGGLAINPLYFCYMLATTWHETGIIERKGKRRYLIHSMQPVEEMGKGRGRRYGRKVNMRGRPYKGLNHIYYGRGYVQLTWIDNYAKMRDVLGVDFINKPELALEPEHAANILIEGMLKGLFTGLSLSKCIRYGSYAEFVYARKIINGTDRAEAIARYAVELLEAIEVK